jgi:hypothetical protein
MPVSAMCAVHTDETKTEVLVVTTSENLPFAIYCSQKLWQAVASEKSCKQKS